MAINKAEEARITKVFNEAKCPKCEEYRKAGGWDDIDLLILHKNDHVWPGYAGEPDGGNYGGSDF